jgi:hypothetical protein
MNKISLDEKINQDIKKTTGEYLYLVDVLKQIKEEPCYLSNKLIAEVILEALGEDDANYIAREILSKGQKIK